MDHSYNVYILQQKLKYAVCTVYMELWATGSSVTPKTHDFASTYLLSTYTTQSCKYSPSLILAHETTHRGYRGFNMPIYFLQVWGETVCHITTRMDKDKDRVMCTYVCVGDAGLNSLTMDACMLLCLARYN